MGTRKILLNTSFSIVEKMWKAKDLNDASKRNSLKHKKVLYYNFELQLGWWVGQYWTVLRFYSKNRNYIVGATRSYV